MAKTKIPWAEHTWNPFTGCSPISDGCKNCYAKAIAERFAGIHGYSKKNPFKITLRRKKLVEPIKRQIPTVYFVGSMGDLFHPDLKESYRDEIFNVIYKTPWHTYLILTKRPEAMVSYFERLSEETGRTIDKLFPNLGIGVTVEDNSTLWRIHKMSSIPAAMHFVSFEPMLENIGICYDHAKLFDWAILGSESGTKRRKMEESWVLDFIERNNSFEEHKVKVFYKQQYVGNKKVLMPELNGKVYAEVPDFIFEREASGKARFEKRKEVKEKVKLELDRILRIGDDRRNWGKAEAYVKEFDWDFLSQRLNGYEIPDYRLSYSRQENLAYIGGSLNRMAEEETDIQPRNTKSLANAMIQHKIQRMRNNGSKPTGTEKNESNLIF